MRPYICLNERILRLHKENRMYVGGQAFYPKICSSLLSIPLRLPIPKSPILEEAATFRIRDRNNSAPISPLEPNHVFSMHETVLAHNALHARHDLGITRALNVHRVLTDVAWMAFITSSVFASWGSGDSNVFARLRFMFSKSRVERSKSIKVRIYIIIPFLFKRE